VIALLRAVWAGLPEPLKRPVRRVREGAKALPGTVAVLRSSRPKPGEIRVFYGAPRIPRLHETSHGGIVKVQYMQTRFPNSPDQFNILYLVSSRLPGGAVQMARLAARRGVRIVWNQNGVAYPAWHGAGWERVNAPLAALVRAAHHVFYQSEFCKLSADRYLGARQGRWEILHNPVDPQLFTPATADPKPGGLVMLLGGTQTEWYRLKTALEVLAYVRRARPEAELLVTGRLCWIPDEQQALRIAKQRAKQLQVEDRVTFLGSYSQVDAPSIFQSAHLLLHTQYNDSCPGVVLEAMACGLPVVYSDSGGVRELVGEEAGIGVPVELSWERVTLPDPVVMANAVLEAGERLEAFAQAARQRATEQFDLQRWLRRHQEVFEGLCR